jgi:MinD superfamily P-loop ATPase
MNNRANEIVILSGKGGTGKTTLTASLSKIINNKVIVDADVDASDLFILLNPMLVKKEKFRGKSVADINQEICTHCGLCEQYCRFDAIHKDEKGDFTVNFYKCDGCALCTYVCPVGAIKMNEEIVGEWYISNTDFGDMVHARLIPGAENSGNLVTMVKRQAQILANEKRLNRIIIDGPPGTGCPVISSLSGAKYAVIVTEPTLSGMHDLDRIIKIAYQFKAIPKIVINKSTLNSDNVTAIENFAEKNNIDIIGRIPFDKCVVKNLEEKLTPIEGSCGSAVKGEIKKIADYLESIF